VTVGQFDYDLFLRFKAETDPAKRRRLHHDLVVQNDPLTKVLVAQMCGRGENRPGRRQKFKREPYVEQLTEEEQIAAGRIGMAKAIERFDPKIRDARRVEYGHDPAKNAADGLPAFAAWRIKFELQQAIEKSGYMTIRRGVHPDERPRNAERLDDPEHVERVVQASDEYLGNSSDETLEERWQREQKEENAPHKTTSAIGEFIERCILFEKQCVTIVSRLIPYYRAHAITRGFPVSFWMLEEELVKRGAARIRAIDRKIHRHIGSRSASWVTDLVEEPALGGVRMKDRAIHQ
jgi:hypothetical protein